METLSVDTLVYIFAFIPEAFGMIARVSKLFYKYYKSKKTSMFCLEPFSLYQWLWTEYNCPINCLTFLEAARTREYKTSIRWLRDRSTDWDSDTLVEVIYKKDLDTTIWLIENGCPLTEWCIKAAAKVGFILIFKWLIERNIPLNKSPRIAYSAAITGQSFLLHWLYMQGWQLNEDVCLYACKNNHWNIVKWVIASNLPYSRENILKQVIARNNRHMLSWLLLNINSLPFEDCSIVATAAKYCDISICKWLIDTGFSCDKTSLYFAASVGNLPVLQWLVNTVNLPLDKRVIEEAAYSGHISSLNWLKTKRCPIDHLQITYKAVSGSNPRETLFWALSCGGRLSSHLTEICALKGNISLLKELIQAGCPFNPERLKRIGAASRSIILLNM